MTRNAWRPNHRMLRDSEPAAKVVEQKSRAALALIRRGDGSGGSSSGAEPGEAAIRQALNALATAKPIAKLKVRRWLAGELRAKVEVAPAAGCRVCSDLAACQPVCWLAD